MCLACRPAGQELISFVSVSLDGWTEGGRVGGGFDPGPWRLKAKSSNPVICFYDVLVEMESVSVWCVRILLRRCPEDHVCSAHHCQIATTSITLCLYC